MMPAMDETAAAPAKEQIKEYWESHAPGQWYSRKPKGGRDYYDEIERHRYGRMYRYLPEVFELDRHPGSRVLEVGCGIGTDALRWARGGARVTAVDLTEEAISEARRRFELYGYDADLRVADAERLPFEDGSFDLVYSFGVLHHTPDTQRALDEIHRVLKSGGRAHVMLYHRSSYTWYVSFLLFKGILRGELLRHSIREIMHRHAEYKDRTPLVKCYTRREAAALFSRFATVSFSVNAARGPGGISERLPLPVFDWIARRWGFNLCIKATK
jgi:ubiquinone/menaquinone biosynthesis C-methylase UbiE